MVNRSYIFLCFCFCFIIFSNAQEKNKAHSFNYSEVTEHPRIIFKKGEESKILAAVNKNKEYKIIHDYILETADKYLELPPLIYKKKGKRSS